MASPVTKIAVESLSPERARRFQAEAYERLQALRGPDGIRQPVEALFGVARNP